MSYRLFILQLPQHEKDCKSSNCDLLLNLNRNAHSSGALQNTLFQRNNCQYVHREDDNERFNRTARAKLTCEGALKNGTTPNTASQPYGPSARAESCAEHGGDVALCSVGSASAGSRMQNCRLTSDSGYVCERDVMRRDATKTRMQRYKHRLDRYKHIKCIHAYRIRTNTPPILA